VNPTDDAGDSPAFDSIVRSKICSNQLRQLLMGARSSLTEMQ